MVHGGYSKDQFNITAFMTDKLLSNNANMLSRLQNCLAKAIQGEVLLPKLIVVVLDDDLINFFDYPDTGISKSLGKLIDHLMKEFNKLVAIQKEFLPKRARKPSYPSIIWIEAPLHNNFANNAERVKFNRELNNVVRFHEHSYVLKLKKIWDPSDTSLYAAEYSRYTNEGLTSYWIAVDYTIKFMDTILLKKTRKPKQVTSKSDNTTDTASNSPHRGGKVYLNREHPDFPR